jgi:predicted amidohydrolase YtcJ
MFLLLSASLILHDGKVFIGPGRYASAVAVEGEKIVKIGDDQAVLQLRGPDTKVIDLDGKAVTPGFHDAHVHFMKGALSLIRADLFGVASPAEVQKRLRVFIASDPPEEWAQGRGWDHTAWGGKYPTRQDLDAVVSTRPVVLVHTDGNEIIWANTLALKLAGLEGEEGVVTGEKALKLEKAVPLPSRAVKKAALERALALAREAGVTSIQGQLDFAPDEQLEIWKELSPSLRYFVWGEIDKLDEAERLRRKAAAPLSVVGVKGVLDGVISARTAAMLEPYSDDKAALGELRYRTDDLEAKVKKARLQGFQPVLHAVGDRAVRQALEACSPKSPPKKPLPACKLEHVEVAHPEDIPLFRRHGVTASVQPSHMTYDREDQNYNPQRLGERSAHAFAWRSFERAGVVQAFGTDWPVMPLHPRVNLFAATTRRHFDDKPAGGWIPEEKIGLEWAVSHYTLDPARAVGRKDLGVLEAGRLADIVVWEDDLFSKAGLDLLKAEVAMTIFGGKVVFSREAGSAGAASSSAP